jgi:hypothetical protein
MGHRNQVGFTKVFQDLSKDKYYDYLKIWLKRFESFVKQLWGILQQILILRKIHINKIAFVKLATG